MSHQADDAAPRAENHHHHHHHHSSSSSLDRKRPHAEEDSSSDGRDPVRPRPLSWHPSAPVEPPLKSSQLRSLGVQSILNPPAKGSSVTAASPIPPSSSSELGEQQLSTSSPSHQRLPSSPTVRLPSPSIHHHHHHHHPRLSASPGMRNRQMITPISPSARFVTTGAGYPGKVGASQSPLAHESRPGLYTVTPGSPLPLDSGSAQTTSVSVHHQPAPASIHSTPTFHSRRTSINPTPNASSQETSPTTPISAFSQFGRSSPALTVTSGPPPAPAFLNSASLYGTMEPVPRLPSVAAGTSRHVADESAAVGGAQPEDSLTPGMIPCVLDLKSGSSSQAEKRRANSDASRRFRNRKRNEMQMEQKITAQQDEIRKQADVMQRQDQEIRALLQERDYYRSERDFYRDHISRLGPSAQIPARPESPQTFRSSIDNNTPSDRDHQAWHGVDTMRAVPIPSTRTPGNWSSAPSQYSTSSMTHLTDEHHKSLPQLPGTWTRP